MLNIDFVHWEDYYNNEYLPKYEQIKESACNYKYSDELFNKFVEYFNIACNMMKYFVWNNGEYYFPRKTILRKIFRLDYIQDGDTWMILDNILSKDSLEDGDKKELLDIAFRDKFNVFEELTEQFGKLADIDEYKLTTI